METVTGEISISSDPTTKGFDLSAGTKWIYPLNYPFRNYQHTITETALFHNTLVCLPTGLGKTFIAAVVMYNYWRWYPQGKIVFLAPTKPLVAQQIDACYNIMGIPPGETIELTGSMNQKNRRISWFRKRVIFATPQVLQNDLGHDIAPGDLIRCVVIDEAHKALGKHSYCESIRLLRTKNECFRILALSATPGSKEEAVQQVIQNLCISRLELRDETSRDIMPYLNKRQMDIILVPLGDNLSKFKQKFVGIMNFHLRRLVDFKVLTGDINAISKGRIFYLTQEFKAKTQRNGNYGQIMKILNRCMSLTHAYELLVRHGLRAFCAFCENHSDDLWMNGEPQLKDLLVEIQKYLGPFPSIEPLLKNTKPEVSKDVIFGHSKFYRLKQLLSQHFQKFQAQKEDTRAIVFVEYRESVNEVFVCLLQLQPLIRPQMFVGQAGQKRKQQVQAMEAFRSNDANVLISTSVGEEGLDVGEVDLIVCFDMLQRSPIRLVQRMGRTGRRRDGRIIMLVTDGKEHQTLKSTIEKRDHLNNKILHSKTIASSLYQNSPRMVPPSLMPQCHKIHIEIQVKNPQDSNNAGNCAENDEVKNKKKGKKTGKKIKNQVPQCQDDKVKSTQPTMLSFLKKPSTHNNDLENISNVPSQSGSTTQVAQSQSIKLLTSDEVAVEFLTLCAIKASKSDDPRHDFNRMDTGDLPKYALDSSDCFSDYPVPDLSILKCLATLEEYKESTPPSETQDDYDDEFDKVPFIHEHHNYDFLDKVDDDDLSNVGESRFEDLLNDSFDSDETIFAEVENAAKPKDESQHFHVGKSENLECSSGNAAARKNQGEKGSSVNYQRDATMEEDFDSTVPGIFERCSSDSNDYSKQSVDDIAAEPTGKGASGSILSDSSNDDDVNIDPQMNVHKYIDESSKPCAKIESPCNETNRQPFNANFLTIRGSKNRSTTTRNIPSKNTRTADVVYDPQQSNVLRTTSQITHTNKRANNNITSSFFKPINVERSRATTNFDKPTMLSNFANTEFVNASCEGSLAKRSQKTFDEDPDPIVIDDDDDDDINVTSQTTNGSNDCTITQMMDHIPNSSSKKNVNAQQIQSSEVKNRTINLSVLNKSKVFDRSINKSEQSNYSITPERLTTTERSMVSSTSRFFGKNTSVKSESETAAAIDIDWDDVWEIDDTPRKNSDETESPVKTAGAIEITLSEIFRPKVFKSQARNELPAGERRTIDAPVAKNAKTSTPSVDEFNLDGYEWDSDFETPDNPVESLKRFASPKQKLANADTNINSRTGRNSYLSQFKNDKVQLNTSQKQRAPKFGSPNKMQLSTNKKVEIGRPSTSKARFPELDDCDDGWFETDLKEKDNKPSTNYAFVSTKGPIKFSHFEVSMNNKENTKPRTGIVDLSAFAARKKSGDRTKLEATESKIGSSENRITREYRRSIKRKRKMHDRKLRSNLGAQFLDCEAEVSCDSSSESTGDDDDLEGLVSYTQDLHDSVDMHAHYLQSVRDLPRPGAFHFKNVKTIVPDDEVFSQSMTRMEPSMYEIDSFCVSEGDEEYEMEDTHSDVHEITIDKRQKRTRSKNGHLSKKRKLLRAHPGSSSSEDETEKLRNEIIDQSMIMKKRKE